MTCARGSRAKAATALVAALASVAVLATGCPERVAPSAPVPASAPAPAPVRIDGEDRALIRAVERGGARPAEDVERRGGNCWQARPSRDARRDGLRAGDFARAWSAAAAGERPGGWLLDDVDRIEAEGATVELCAAWTARDLAQRLRHPALWAEPADLAAREGPGSGCGGIEAVDVGGDPLSALALDRIDLVRLGARGVERWDELRAGLDAAQAVHLALADAPAWDRLWVLAVSPDRRWLNDPTLRRWLSRAVDRAALAASLGEMALPLRALAAGDPRRAAEAAAAEPAPDPGERPLSATSRPRLDLVWEAGDGSAAVLAAALLARADAWGVALSGRPVAPGDLARAVEQGSADLALVPWVLGVRDPVLRLETFLHELPTDAPAHREALRILRRARELGEPAPRAAAAGEAAAVLERAGTRIPLVLEPARIGYRSDRIELGEPRAPGATRALCRGRA